MLLVSCAWNSQLEGSDGWIFFVDNGRRDHLEGGRNAVLAPICSLHAMVVERDNERLRRIVDVIDLRFAGSSTKTDAGH